VPLEGKIEKIGRFAPATRRSEARGGSRELVHEVALWGPSGYEHFATFQPTFLYELTWNRAYGVMVFAIVGERIAGITGFPDRPLLFSRLYRPSSSRDARRGTLFAAGCRGPAAGFDIFVRAPARAPTRKERAMKYMLLTTYAPTPGVPPMIEWAPEDMKAFGEAMGAIHEELIANGELVGTERLAGPEAVKIVTHDGVGAPVVTDGPFAESKEFLAGYWLVDVESEERAIEIAARTSAAPGPSGKPWAKEIQVRAVMGAPPNAEL
jgi:hypothetical protein